MSAMYVFWQDPESRRWYPVGMLTQSNQTFRFVYTKGAAKAREYGFIPFGRMRDLYLEYESRELFPFFANRMLSISRPDYHDYMRWIGAEDDKFNKILALSRTGGSRATDNLMLYMKPQPNECNEFDLFFLIHGIRHLPKVAIERVNALEVGDSLYPMYDILNEYDRDAVAIRTNDPSHFVGYIPRFFASDVKECISRNRPIECRLTVARVNRDAPFQLRMLCRFTSPWPESFYPCSGIEYEPLIQEESIQQGKLSATHS